MIRRSLILVFSSFALFSSSSSAEPRHQRGKNIVRVMIRDLDLTSDQRDVLSEMRQSRGDEKRAHSKDKKKKKMNWKRDFVAGDLDEKQIYSEIDQEFETGVEKRLSMMKKLFEFVETLSEEQREQALVNVQEEKDFRRERMEEKREMREDENEDREKKDKMEPLFSDIDLTEEQLDQKELIKSLFEDSFSDKKADQKTKGELIEKMLMSEVTFRQAKKNLRIKAKRNKEFRYSITAEWIELLSSFDDDQKETFLSNIASLEKRHKKRMERKQRRRNHR